MSAVQSKSDALDLLDPKTRRSVRVSEARAKGTHDLLDWNIMVAVCGYRCVMCRADGIRDVILQKDHATSIREGGCDCIANIQPLCPRCNSIKGCGSADYRPKGWSQGFETTMLKVREIFGKAAV